MTTLSIVLILTSGIIGLSLGGLFGLKLAYVLFRRRMGRKLLGEIVDQLNKHNLEYAEAYANYSDACAIRSGKRELN